MMLQPQVMHVSPQPGHLTGNEGSEQSYPVFAPLMMYPQDQFLFQNQQFQNALGQFATENALVMPQANQTQTTQQVGEGEEGGEESEATTPALSSASTPLSSATTPLSTATTPSFSASTTPIHLPAVAPAQFMNPLVFPQMPMHQMPMGHMGQQMPMGHMGQQMPMGHMGQQMPMGHMGQQMPMGHMGQIPQFVPCVVPGGAFPPTFQPMYFVQQPNAPVFNHQPVQHPISIRSDSSHSRHEHSKSYDGSEFSDIKSNSLRRFSSDHSKDGYGSDYCDNRSRVGSELDDGDRDENRKVQPQQYYKNNHYVDPHNSNKRQYRGRERSRSGSQKRPTSQERQEEMYKTELCSAWVNQKKCRFGHRCIFAHGVHELRAAKRKQDRQNMRPPLKKFVTGLLNKLCEANYEQVITEFMTVCLEEISDRNVNENGVDIMKAFFNRVVAGRELRQELVDSVSKLFKSHPYADSLKQSLSDACLSEYNNPRSKAIALSTIDLVGMLVSRRLIDAKIVHQILGETQLDDPKPIKVELWLKLIENLKNKVDTTKYFSELAKFKSMSTRIRFAIMDLEDLQKNNWIK